MTSDPAPDDAPLAATPAGNLGPSFAVAIRDEIVRQSLDAIVIADPESRIRVWNPAAEELYGIRADEAIGQRFPDLVDIRELDGRPVDVAAARDDVRRTGAGHRRLTYLPLRGSLVGRPLTIDSVVTLLRDAAGGTIGFLAVNRDSSATELGEERLLNRRMRVLVELTRLSNVAAVDRSDWDRFVAEVGAVVEADATAFGRGDGERMSLAGVDGLDADVARRLMDRPVADMPIATLLAAGSNTIISPIEGGNVSELASRVLGAMGFRTLAAFPIRDNDRLVGIVLALFKRTRDELELDDRALDAIGRVLDISFANRRLREGLQASEKRYRELFESSPDALLVQNLDEFVLDANPAAIRLYGEDLIGKHVYELVADPDDFGLGVANPHGSTQFTGVGRRLDGTTFPEEVDLRPIEIGGEPRMLVIVRDLTERSRLQGELIQAQKMEAIGMLVAGVAHELNNPLASIVAFSQLLRTDPDL
ncbi:MAG: PAS domain S-box protein, partial [Chloroflexi bacterium]|nr:PAS domain S-box protein [Chloroflexota bacterium]